ncbi:hypothetical protein [Oligosphaera ethanolica]|uniref:Uncharacterized protein n=1 Tax=Oligosphaera ethanolica TaxID=760260 RepID=A0AAE3VG83_9BACT|nr:hypothetical protein [Oligosphaera ethanolica]MDQ0289831.1 hypothetical protein [Oligosphaera ethanolica]
MVRGMELFRGFFQDFHDHFTLIGGTACDLHLKDLGGFRATKDIDILVLLERMNREFATRFHQFLRRPGGIHPGTAAVPAAFQRRRRDLR